MTKVFRLLTPFAMETVLPLPITEFFGNLNCAMRYFLSFSTLKEILIHPRFERDHLDLIGQGIHMNGTVAKAYLALVIDPGQGMLEPVLVIPLWIVFAGMRPAAFSTVIGRADADHGLAE